MSPEPKVVDRLTWVVEGLELRPDDQVVEIGPGHGVAASAVLDQLGPDGRYLGVDRSPKMTAAASTRNAAALAAGRARFVTTDLLAAPVEPSSQHRVFACRVTATASPQAIERALGWLTPGGALSLAFDDPGGRRADGQIDQVLATACQVGVADVSVRRAALASGSIAVAVLRV